MIDLSVRVGGLTLANPVMPASGTFAEGLDKLAIPTKKRAPRLETVVF